MSNFSVKLLSLKKIAGIVALKSVGGVFYGLSGTTVPLFQ